MAGGRTSEKKMINSSPPFDISLKRFISFFIYFVVSRKQAIMLTLEHAVRFSVFARIPPTTRPKDLHFYVPTGPSLIRVSELIRLELEQSPDTLLLQSISCVTGT